jgi:hypothetical protein
VAVLLTAAVERTVVYFALTVVVVAVVVPLFDSLAIAEFPTLPVPTAAAAAAVVVAAAAAQPVAVVVLPPVVVVVVAAAATPLNYRAVAGEIAQALRRRFAVEVASFLAKNDT